MQNLHETNACIVKKSLKISFLDPPFLKHASKFNDFFLLSDRPLNIVRILKNQKKDPVLKVVSEWITESSRLLTKTPELFVSPFWLVDYQFLTNLFNDEIIEMMKFKIEHLKYIDDFPQCTNDNLFSQTFRSCLPLSLFHSVYDNFHDYSHAGLQESQYSFNQYYFIPFLRNWLSILFRNLLIAKCIHVKILTKTKMQTYFSQSCQVFPTKVSLCILESLKPCY